MTNLAPEEKKTEYITKKKTKRKMGPAGLGKKEGKIKIIMVGEDGKMLDQPMFEKFSKGGSVKKKKSSGKAIRGKGCEIR